MKHILNNLSEQEKNSIREQHTGGSQFFICHNRQGTQHLDGNHTCFGKVVEGLDVIDQIQQGDKITSIEMM